MDLSPDTAYLPDACGAPDAPRPAPDFFSSTYEERKRVATVARTPSSQVALLTKRPIAEMLTEERPCSLTSLGLQVTWSAEDIVKAIEHATRYDAYDVRAVERILEARFKPRSL